MHRLRRIPRNWVASLASIALPLIWSGLAPGIEVRLQALDGSAIEGTMQSADSDRVELLVQGDSQSRSASDILRIEFLNSRTATPEPWTLELVDGSVLRGNQLLGAEQAWKFSNSAGIRTDLGPGAVRTLQLRSLTPELEREWNALVASATDGDALILLRPENTLDRVGGVIQEVKSDAIAFELDGQLLDVAMEKLAGAVWLRRALPRIQPATEILLTDGSRIFAKSFSLQSDRIQLQTRWGAAMDIDLGRVLALNYASANLKWLAEVPVLESKGRSGLLSSQPIARMQQALAPRFLSTEPATGNAADSDLVFPMPGELVFRMPDGFQRFQTVVARSDSGEKRTALTLEIWQDDERIVSKTLGPDEESIPLEIAIAPNKKVRLVVDAPSQLRIGSRVTWKQPRLTR